MLFSLLLGVPVVLMSPSTDGTALEPQVKSEVVVEAAMVSDTPALAAARARMVSSQIARRGVRDPLVLQAMEKVRRHALMPEEARHRAYGDHPVPIGHEQTISQPYIVALMTEMVGARPGMKVLDVGTGSGYQAAVLAEIVDHVYSIDIVCPLADQARARLTALEYKNVTVRCGDGWAGWAEEAPFDAIVLAAAPKDVPPALIEQLAPGGRLVLPVGPNGSQTLLLVEKDAEGNVTQRETLGVRFVPMTGEAQRAERASKPPPAPDPPPAGAKTPPR